jgi:hypothetical protein
MRLIIVVENQCAIDNLGEGIREVRSALLREANATTSTRPGSPAPTAHVSGRPVRALNRQHVLV